MKSRSTHYLFMLSQGERTYHDIHDILITNPFLQKRAIIEVGLEYGIAAKLEFDDDGKLPFIRCNVKFVKFLENQYSINVEVETENRIVKVMHLPPFHRLENLKHKEELMLRLVLGSHKIAFQNANQPKIIYLDEFDLRHLWEFSKSRKVFHLFSNAFEINQ